MFVFKSRLRINASNKSFCKQLEVISKAKFSISRNQNFYEVLEIHKGATMLDVKKAYYKKVKLYHPDHNKESDAEEKFKILVAAYETLKDPAKRQIYDLSQGNPHFSAEGRFSEDYQYTGDRQAGEKYYENKWYNYKKSEQDTLRDEYFKASVQYQESLVRNNVIYRVAFVLFTFVFLDLLKHWREQKHLQFRATQKEIINKHQFEESPLVLVEKAGEKVKIQSLQDYINTRFNENRVV